MKNQLNYYNNLPQKRSASGALFLNKKGEVLLVKPTYKDGWGIPGGTVENNESPLLACKRETKEELGLTLKNFKFLLAYYQPKATKPECYHFVFYGGVLSTKEAAKIRLPEKELSEFKFFKPSIAAKLTSKETGEKILAGIKIIKSKKAEYLESTATN